jgi:lipopolysaccharide export LptBFGC system permease protein LptF
MNTTPRNPRGPLTLPVLALISFLFLPGKRRRRWITMAVLLIASLGAVTALTGCGGGFGLVKVLTPTTYNITVTGTSGSTQQSTTVQLTVQ